MTIFLDERCWQMSYQCALFGEWCACWRVACAVHRVNAQHIYVTAFYERAVQARNAREVQAHCTMLDFAVKRARGAGSK